MSGPVWHRGAATIRADERLRGSLMRSLRTPNVEVRSPPRLKHSSMQLSSPAIPTSPRGACLVRPSGPVALGGWTSSLVCCGRRNRSRSSCEPGPRSTLGAGTWPCPDAEEADRLAQETGRRSGEGARNWRSRFWPGCAERRTQPERWPSGLNRSACSWEQGPCCRSCSSRAVSRSSVPAATTTPTRSSGARSIRAIRLRRKRRVAESRVPLRAARDGFDALGVVSWSERARQELRTFGRDEPGPDTAVV
jgi:hypothetical protein